MFSGIIEEFATVVAIEHDRENIDFTLTCSFTNELSID
jgi:riboflavin synthase